MFRNSSPEVFLRNGVLKICSKYTGEHQCRSVISLKLQSNFIEIVLRHGCSPVNLLHIFRTAIFKNTSVRLLLDVGHGPRSGQGSQFHSLFEHFSFFVFSGFFAKAIQIFKGQPSKMP